MLGAVKGLNADTGEHYDDTLLYVERAELTDAQRAQILEGNARRVFPRLAVRIPS